MLRRKGGIYMGQTCDLHIHSTFSDGTYTPEQLLQAAEACGLSAVALCDHNTVAGLPNFLAAGEKSRVEAVAGTELPLCWRISVSGKTKATVIWWRR